MTVEWLTGDVLEHVRGLDDDSIDLAVGSPPFLVQRDYNGLPGQWGHEDTPAEFLDHLLELTTELRRVVKPAGSIAIEIGDTYSGSGGAGGDYGEDGWRSGQAAWTGSAAADKSRWASSDDRPDWPLAKSLCGTPTLFGDSLAYGRNLLNPDHTFEPWRVRNRIVWARSNPTPGQDGDKYRRGATSYITVACTGRHRWFDLDAVRTPGRDAGRVDKLRGGTERVRRGRGRTASQVTANHEKGTPPNEFWTDEYDGDVAWLINNSGSTIAHYAMWPAALAERLILAMCPPGGHVLDPFAGTGTTLAVADIHGRHATGIDLDPANQELYERRYAECWRALRPGPSPITPGAEQLDLLDMELTAST